MKKILIIVFLVITSCGLVFSCAKFFWVSANSPEIYEVASPDGARYTTKKGSYNKFTDSAEFELEDGTTVILTNGYSYKLLNSDSDEVKRWKNIELLYALIATGCTLAWATTLALFFNM